MDSYRIIYLHLTKSTNIVNVQMNIHIKTHLDLVSAAALSDISEISSSFQLVVSEFSFSLQALCTKKGSNEDITSPKPSPYFMKDP